MPILFHFNNQQLQRCLTIIVVFFCAAQFIQLGYAQDRVDSLTPFITLAPGISVQVGLIGTNPEHDLEPVAVFKLNRSGINTTFGKSKDGVLFDFAVTRPIVDGLSYRLSTRNHLWKSQGTFSDNRLSINGNQILVSEETTKFRIRPEAFFAYASQQQGATRITAPRLGIVVTNELSRDLQAFGTFRLANRNSLNYYPSTTDWQYAVRFQPSWTLPFYENRLVTSFDFQIANAASPFNGYVDRLGDINKFSVVWHFEPKTFLSGTLKNSLGLSFDWLKDIEENQSPLQSAFWVLDTRQSIDEFVFELRLELQAAALLAENVIEVEDSDLRASFSLDTKLYHNDWRYHFKGEYKFVHPDKENDIDIFEFGLGPVIELDGQNLRPYIALDFAEPLFNDGALDTIKLVGVGFEVLQ